MSLELCNLHRIWYPVISEFRFSAGINIVKMGRWDKDDPSIDIIQPLSYRKYSLWNPVKSNSPEGPSEIEKMWHKVGKTDISSRDNL